MRERDEGERREMKSVDGNRTVASSETIIYSVIDICPYVSNLIYVLSSICNGYVFIMILNFQKSCRNYQKLIRIYRILIFCFFFDILHVQHFL